MKIKSEVSGCWETLTFSGWQTGKPFIGTLYSPICFYMGLESAIVLEVRR